MADPARRAAAARLAHLAVWGLAAGAGTGGLPASAQTTPDTPSPEPGFDVQPWPARLAMPRLEAPDLSGKLWRLQDLAGRAVMLNFWATWCPACLAELPSLQALAELHGPDKLVVLAINVKETDDRVRAFVRTSDLRLPVVPDPLGELTRRWQVTLYPSTLLIDRNGRPRQRVRGDIDWLSPQAQALVAPLFRRRRS